MRPAAGAAAYWEKTMLKILIVLLSSSFLYASAVDPATERLWLKCNHCRGGTNPGERCYAGPGGPIYDGPGGTCYAGAGGPLYTGPGGPLYAGPGGPCYSGPGGSCYSGPGGDGENCSYACEQ